VGSLPTNPKTPMSNMPAVIEAERLASLRSRAASRLTGSAAAKGDTARAVDALTVLHALASSRETASDALTLLHEFQVHQVELELQAQELHDSRVELESALRRQMQVYDHLPVGCFTVDPRWTVRELNQTAAAMLGVGCAGALGLPLDAFLCAESARRLRAAVACLDGGTSRVSCWLNLSPKNGPMRPVLASIGVDPAANGYLLSLTNAAAEAAPPPERA
jgi:PAS domain-containing protein